MVTVLLENSMYDFQFNAQKLEVTKIQLYLCIRLPVHLQINAQKMLLGNFQNVGKI